MARAPASIILRWQELEQRGVRVPLGVWAEFDRYCLARMEAIAALVQKNNGGDLAVEDARAIGIEAMAVRKFISGIGGSPDGESRLDQGRLWLERTVLDLVHHYIGNDLYKIVLIADVYDQEPQPVPAADAARLLDCVKAVGDFLEQLKRKTS